MNKKPLNPETKPVAGEAEKSNDLLGSFQGIV
jgi:hypothetical protein